MSASRPWAVTGQRPVTGDYRSVPGRMPRRPAEAFIGQLNTFGLPPWLVEALGAAVTSPEIPDDQSSATIERILRRKPGTLEQFVADHRAAFEAG